MAETKGLTWFLGVARDPGKDGPAFVPRAEGEFDGSAEFRIPNLSPGRYKVHLASSAKYAVQVIAARTSHCCFRVHHGTVRAACEPMAKATGRMVDAATGKGIPKVSLSHESPRRGPKSRQGSMGGSRRMRKDGTSPTVRRANGSSRSSTRLPPGYVRPEGQKLSAKLDPKTPHTFPDLKFRKTITLHGLVVNDGRQAGSRSRGPPGPNRTCGKKARIK